MIPSSVVINGNIWEIIEEEEIFWEGASCWGLCHYDEKKISIKKSLSKKNKLLVGVHEKIHAILYEHGIKLNEKVDEKIAECLSSELLKIYKMRYK